MKMNINQLGFKHFTLHKLVLYVLPKHHFPFTKLGSKTILLNGIGLKILIASFPGSSSKSQHCHNKPALGSLVTSLDCCGLRYIQRGEPAVILT